MSNPTISEILNGLEFKPVSYIPDVLFSKTGVDCYQIDDDSIAAIEKHMTVGQAYDFVFGSDEVFDIRVYAYDGVPFVLSERIGDVYEGTLTVFNRSVWLKFVSDVLLAGCDVESPDECTLSRNQYIVFGAGGSFKVETPAWQYGFDELFTRYHATYDGHTVSFVRFVNKQPAWADSANRIVVKIDGVETTIDGCDVVFHKRA